MMKTIVDRTGRSTMMKSLLGPGQIENAKLTTIQTANAIAHLTARLSRVISFGSAFQYGMIARAIYTSTTLTNGNDDNTGTMSTARPTARTINTYAPHDKARK